jgi:uncharacterized protein YjbJ (UPF0337 family)
MADKALRRCRAYYKVGSGYTGGTNPNLSGNTGAIFGDNTYISGYLSISGDTSGLTGMIDCIKGSVSGLKAYTTNLQGDVSCLVGTIPSAAFGYVTNIRGPMTTGTSTTVSRITGCIAGITGSTSNIWGDVSDIVGNVTNMRGDVTGLKGDISKISGLVTKVFGKVSPTLSGDLSPYEGDISYLTGVLPVPASPGSSVKKLTGRVTNIKGSIPDYTGLTGLHGDLSGIVGYFRTSAPALYGNLSGLSGDIRHVFGDATGITGNATGVTGSLDLCGLTSADRSKGVALSDLIGS